MAVSPEFTEMYSLTRPLLVLVSLLALGIGCTETPPPAPPDYWESSGAFKNLNNEGILSEQRGTISLWFKQRGGTNLTNILLESSRTYRIDLEWKWDEVAEVQVLRVLASAGAKGNKPVHIGATQRIDPEPAYYAFDVERFKVVDIDFKREVHMVLSWDREGEIRFYLNGKRTGTLPAKSAPQVKEARALSTADVGEHHIRIYKRQLSDEEVLELFKAGPGSVAASPSRSN